MENELKLTQDQLVNLIKISGIEVNPDYATSDDISRALISIEKKLNFFNYPLSFFTAENLNVLIVDDMELSIYQLTTMLKKIGMNVFVARNKDEAIGEIKKKHFDFLVLDLFLPDAQDGFELIKFANEFKQEQSGSFKILTISGTDNKDVIQEAYRLGVDEFIPKQQDWHEKIMKFISISTSRVDDKEFSKYNINDDICVFTVYKINNQKYIDSLYKAISTTVLSGKKNIVLNLEYIKIFSDAYASIFAEIVKLANERQGQFIIIKPSDDVKKALDYVFLSNVIQTTDTIDEAVSYIEAKNSIN